MIAIEAPIKGRAKYEGIIGHIGDQICLEHIKMRIPQTSFTLGPIWLAQIMRHKKLNKLI